VEYRIKEGCHRSKWFPKITSGDLLIGSFSFIGDPSYDIGAKQKDTNKLIGLSDNYHHHKDSIRIGWRCLNSRIEIMAICYSNSKRTIEHITYVDPNEIIKFIVSIEKDKYVIMVGDVLYTHKRTSKWRFLRYYLFPFFGGNTKAPKDFKIIIKL
jgi:hypothetical protein